MAAKKPKRTRAETPLVQARVDEVTRLRLEGYERRDVQGFVREQEQRPGSLWHEAGTPPMSITAVDNYLSKADDSLREKHDRTRQHARRRHLAQRRHLYRRLVAKGEEADAAKILKDEAEMLGLYPPKKTAETDARGKDKKAGVRDDDAIGALLARFGIHPPPGGIPPSPCGTQGPPPV